MGTFNGLASALFAFASVLSVLAMVMGLYKTKLASEGRSTLFEAISYIMTGSILGSMALWNRAIVQTFFGKDPQGWDNNPDGYFRITTDFEMKGNGIYDVIGQNTLTGVFLFLILFGLYHFIAGTWSLRLASCPREGNVGGSFVRIIAGSMFVNFAMFSCEISSWTGISSLCLTG